MDNWSVAEFGELAVRNEGADGSASSLMCTNRLKPNVLLDQLLDQTMQN